MFFLCGPATVLQHMISQPRAPRYFFLGCAVTLNLKKMMSPSKTTYSLPFCLYLPLAFTLASEPASLRSANAIVSAMMKPRSKSLWMTPAACGALVPFCAIRCKHSRRRVGADAGEFGRVGADSGEFGRVGADSGEFGRGRAGSGGFGRVREGSGEFGRVREGSGVLCPR